MIPRAVLRAAADVLADVHLWEIVVPLLAAPVAALLLIAHHVRRSGSEVGPNGAGPGDRAALAAFVDSALASAWARRSDDSARGAAVRVRLGERSMRWPDEILTRSRTATIRMDLPDARAERIDALLAADVGDWLRAAEILPERPVTVRVPAQLQRAVPADGDRAARSGATPTATLRHVLIDFGFRHLEAFHDGRLLQIRRLDASASAGTSRDARHDRRHTTTRSERCCISSRKATASSA